MRQKKRFISRSQVIQRTAKGDIFRIAILLTAAVFGAILLASVMLQQYGKTGKYTAGNIILSPEVLQTLNSQNKTKQRIIFDRNELSYFDVGKHQAVAKTMSLEAYNHFYTLVQGDQSLEGDPIELDRQFIQQQPMATITTSMHTESAKNQTPPSKYQIVQIGTNAFRVQLKDAPQGAEGWIYFSHPLIYDQLLPPGNQP